jgi:hypothetical protein
MTIPQQLTKVVKTLSPAKRRQLLQFAEFPRLADVPEHDPDWGEVGASLATEVWQKSAQLKSPRCSSASKTGRGE